MLRKLFERVMKKNCKRQIKFSLELKRYLNEKVINLMPNGKVVIIHLIDGLMKDVVI